MMDQRLFYAARDSKALDYAVRSLTDRGIRFADAPSKKVTHLLLPAPCKQDVSQLLDQLSLDIHVFGGHLDRPELGGYRCHDLLEDPVYLAKNAQLTAHCALTIAAERLPVTLEDLPVLIIGWGRIGKCLAKLLRDCGAEVSVAARSLSDRAMIEALGATPEDPADLSFILKRYRVIFNTAPAPILNETQLGYCRPDVLKIDLASTPGIAGADVIHARGLPAKCVPESSGKLIARTILRLCARKEADR